MFTLAPAAHVVAVDDEPALLRLYDDVLVEVGYRVTSLDSPPDDPRDVLRLAPDLVVIDLVFGGDRRGLPFLRRLRADVDGARLPVIVCTAAVDVLREQDAELRAIGVATLQKPFDIDALIARAFDLCLKADTLRTNANSAVERMRDAVERAASAQGRLTERRQP